MSSSLFRLRQSALSCPFTFLLLLLTWTQAIAYEDFPTVHITDVISPELAQSLQHRVEEANFDGKYINFEVGSDFGNYNISSLSMLRVRVQEITTLGTAMRQFSTKDPELSDHLQGQFNVRADSAIDIITRPVSTATTIAGQFKENMDETLTGVSPEVAQAYQYAESGSDDPVTAMHKRNVAGQWRLDVYSTNPKVQEFLNTVARQRSSGTISAGSPTLFRQIVKPLKVVDRDTETSLYTLLKNNSAEELGFVNDQLLTDMKINPDLREKFLQHRAYSPGHKTRIAHYLEKLPDVRNRSAFIEYSLSAIDESSALNYEEAIMMLVYYHNTVADLQKFHIQDGVLQVLTTENHIVYMGMADLLYWSEETARLFGSLQNQAGIAGFKAWEIITSGYLTTEARSQLQSQNFVIRERFSD